MKNVFSKGMIGSMMVATMLVATTVSAQGLPPQDNGMTLVVDKSVINGSLAHNEAGNLIYDGAGNARFQYTGDIYAIETGSDGITVTGMSDSIGTITGEAAFPKDFVALSAGVNALMQSMMDNTWDGTMPQFPSVVPWTCNHCDIHMNDGKHYVSIVDVLDPDSQYYSQDMVDSFNAGLLDGATGALDNLRMKGRAFTAFGPTSFDPVNRTMGVRMAGCSALVELTEMKIGTLCMNATATFDVSGAIARFNPLGKQVGYAPNSAISAQGSSNCITVLQPMPQQ